MTLLGYIMQSLGDIGHEIARSRMHAAGYAKAPSKLALKNRRSIYRPHQSERECTRRIRQHQRAAENMALRVKAMADAATANVIGVRAVEGALLGS